MAVIATTPTPVIAQNVARQPQRSPIRAPKGTPSTFATVSPANITATARDARSGATATMRRATSEPMPKNVPWHSAATTRPSSITG
jgi:hypothetical protein